MISMRPRIDLNADVGESFGPWQRHHDLALFEVVTTAHIACGFHAGTPTVMDEAVAAALARGVRIGAHPSYPDLVGFGRRDMAASAQEVRRDVLYQVGALDAFARSSFTVPFTIEWRTTSSVPKQSSKQFRTTTRACGWCFRPAHRRRVMHRNSVLASRKRRSVIVVTEPMDASSTGIWRMPCSATRRK